ncbi:hypothetical protein FIBSPDRAFT_925857 [Athelia psychrophila]|uniref:Homeobox domain-containing protein n=1 Tax=Athelia psychrophila TaxID=1759441 RepID=A0A166TYI5_9AGAM|nr:hypothetical protein FIBSPDRAFT_925857 [Fibularhizoctonia sp. CBS 109695]
MLSSNIETGLAQLDTLEEEFLALDQLQPSQVQAFLDKFEALAADVDHLSSLPSRLQERLDNLSFSISVVSLNYIDIHNASSSIGNSFSLPTPPHDEPSAPNHPCPPYIASAYKWLLHHIHNPYPTSDEIHSISVTANTTDKRIRNWFVNARQRMGWTKIAKEHFHGDRADAAGAAYRALVQPDPEQRVDHGLTMEFIKMQVAAEDMYCDVFKPTSFAGSLSTSVVAMSTEHQVLLQEMRQQAIQEEAIRKELAHDMKKQRAASRSKSARRSVSAYPSPSRSPEPSSLTDTEEDSAESSAAAGRKRRRSPSSSSSSSSIDMDVHKPKRVRRVKTIDAAATLPSPISSDDSLPEMSSDNSSMESIPPTPTASSSRKRRLSDGQSENPYKRPRGAGFVSGGPRLHAVSAPLPFSGQMLNQENFSMEGFNFDMPPAVTSAPLDPSENLDIHLYNDWDNWGTNNMHAEQAAATPELDMASASFDQFLSDLNSYSPVDGPSQPTPSMAETWNPSFDMNAPLDHSMNPMVTSGEPFGYVNFSNAVQAYDAPMSKTQSAPSPAEIIAQNDAASKLAKLEQLRALREAAQKLEEELIGTSS